MLNASPPHRLAQIALPKLLIIAGRIGTCSFCAGIASAGPECILPLPGRIACLYTIHLIRSYQHKGLQRFAETGSKAGIQPQHAARLRKFLTALNVASHPSDMNAPGNNLHALRGGLEGHWSVRVNGNWRLTFGFYGEDVVSVNYQDYHGKGKK